MMAVASRLHVLLRRKANRITDILWMIANAEYAGEVLRLARAEADDEMLALARENRMSIIVGSAHGPQAITSILSGRTKATLVHP